MLYVDSVRKRIKDRQILNDVFLSCQQGQIIGLFGRNGAGKSTLLKIIFGSLSADYKYVAIDGKKIDTLFDNRNLIYYLPQDNYLPNLRIRNITSCFCDQLNAATLLKNDFIKPLLDKKTKQLSGGERRILEILLMIHSEAAYLLLDEPFNGVAPIYVEMLKNLIKEHSKNKGIIITDHDYESVLDISTTIVLIQDGNTKVIKERKALSELGYLPLPG